MCGCSEEMQRRQQEIIDELKLKDKKPCDCEKHVANFGRARVMANGDIVYARKGSEPPPEIEGFVRDPNDPWRFNKKWRHCTFRIQSQVVKPCGAIGVLTICNNTALPCRGSEVSFATCQACPFQ